MKRSISPQLSRTVIGPLVDALEARQHLAGFSLDVNFQPPANYPPSGYTADRGKAFSWQGPLEYGWNADNSRNTVDRKTSAEDRLDTFAYLDRGASKWEVKVPNGQYQVNLTAGDASSTNAYYSLKVEGTEVLRGAPTSANRWLNRSATVNVTDGRLTVSSGSGAWNNSINSLSIRPAGASPTPTPAPTPTPSNAPAAPTWFSTWTNGNNSIGMNWGDVTGETGYVLQSSTDGVNFGAPISLGANVTRYTAWGLNAGTRYTFKLMARNAAGTSGAKTSAATTSGATPTVNPTPAPSAPASPSYLWSWATGNSSASLQWANVANESGYRIERSTNGSSFSPIATLAADTTLYKATGLSAGTSYTFRVTAYNGGGNSAAKTTTVRTSGTATPTNPVTPPTNPTTPPTNPTTPTPPTAPSGINRFALSGIVQNEVPANVAIPALRALGMTSVRLWYSINSWNDQPNMGDIARAKTFKDAGFTVTLALVSNRATDAGTAKAYFSRVAGNATARAAIDYWEIGNEPNIGAYWNSSLQSFVTNYMKPAYEAIKQYPGEMVVGGGVSWDVNAVRTMVAAGYNNYCDYANFHPYGESGAIVIQRARDAKAAFGNKPMIISEWNVQFITDKNRMAQEVNTAAIGLSNIAYLNYYFALGTGNSHVGQGGAIHRDGTRNTLFWNVIYSWTHG